MPISIQVRQVGQGSGLVNREFHTTNYSSFDNKFYVFAGTDSSQNDTNDLYCLELNGDKVEFQKIETENPPEKRSDHCSVIYNNRIYLLGGFGEKANNALWQFDISQQTFKKVETKNNQMKPSERHGQKAVLYQNKMIVFGGEVFNSGNLTHDLYELNLDTLEWRKIFFEGYVDFEKEEDDAWDNLDPDVAPCPREGFAMETFQNFLVIFGGLDTNSDSLNDLWLFPLDQKGAKWTLIEKQDDAEVWPSERCFHSLVKVSENEILSIFGKQIHDVSEHLSDLSDDEEEEFNEKISASKRTAIDSSSDDSDDEMSPTSPSDSRKKHSSNTSPVSKLSLQAVLNRERMRTSSNSSSNQGSPTLAHKNGTNGSGSPGLSPRTALARKISMKSLSGMQEVTSPIPGDDATSASLWDENFGKNIAIEEAFYIFNFDKMKWEKVGITNTDSNFVARLGFTANYDSNTNCVLIYGGFGKISNNSNAPIAITLQIQ